MRPITIPAVWIMCFSTRPTGWAALCPAWNRDLPVKYDYLAGQFEGNTSQVVVFYYAPPACLRLLDPEIDPYQHACFPMIACYAKPHDYLLPEPILEPDRLHECLKFMHPEPSHGWCYYFERADLARQMGDWEKVAELGEYGFQTG